MRTAVAEAVAPEHGSVAEGLAGGWQNQLGSRLVLDLDGLGGLKGTYCAGAGSLAGRTFPICGSYDPAATGPSVVLGFIVDWTSARCITAWSGQYHPAEGTIRATWLMTTMTEASDEWRSTVIGQDIFERNK